MFLGMVFGLSRYSDMQSCEQRMNELIDFVKEQSSAYVQYNETAVAKALVRGTTEVQELDSLTLDCGEDALRQYTERLWLTGVSVVDAKGRLVCEYSTDGIGYVAAFEKQTDELVALCGLLAEQLDGRPAVSLGCIVRSEKRFHGFGRECLSAMLSCAFARLELDRVVSFIRLDNVGALQTAAAFGMKPIGRCERVHAGQAVPHAVLEMRNPLAAPGGIN